MILRDYQQQIANKAIELLNRHRIVYLSMQVRTGKTITALDICNQYVARRVLFLTKKKAISSILSDFEQTSYKYHLYVTNYEQVYKIKEDFDLIVLDDCVTLANAGEYEKQIRWIQQEVLTRVGPTGKILVVGTRVDPIDMYRELRSNDRYPEGKSPWTYLAMPAVLELDEKPENWVTLWPRSDKPWSGDPVDPDADGLFPRWDGIRLKQRRSDRKSVG